MKKIKVILLAFCAMASIVPAAAQDPMVELPWLPFRDTTGIRTLRTYRVDTLTGERKLRCTDHYDRHGFKYDSLDRLVYDAQGRLTEYVNMGYTYLPDNVVSLRESWRCNINYGPDGTVQRIERVYPGEDLSYYDTYELVSHKVHPKYGLLEYSFRRSRSYEDYIDTVFLRREYDAQGHLLREEYNSTNDFDDDDSYNFRYYYDASGRRIASRGYYYESSDSMNYVYDAQGVLTGIKGIIYCLGMEADVEILCRPDGSYIERWEYWYHYETDYEEPRIRRRSAKPAVFYFRYNEKDQLIYENWYGITEYEREYWE